MYTRHQPIINIFTIDRSDDKPIAAQEFESDDEVVKSNKVYVGKHVHLRVNDPEIKLPLATLKHYFFKMTEILFFGIKTYSRFERSVTVTCQK